MRNINKEEPGFLAQLLAAPPVEYRPAPHWAWNGDMTPERITEQLEQFAAQGCGGVFAFPTPGHVTGYLSGQWFELWKHAVQEANRLGLHCHIYDEFTCPSGWTAGNVVVENPLLQHQEIRVMERKDFAARDSRTVILVRLRMAGGQATIVNQHADATHVIALMDSDHGKGGLLPLPDLLYPETTRLFLQTTHERYRAKCGEAFGSSVVFMYSDEPSPASVAPRSRGLPFSRHIAKEFLLDHGYLLEGEKLLSLALTRDDSPEVRFDFWHTINRLFNENFMKPLHDWCEQNQLLFTGHLVEDYWPFPDAVPDNMASLRWMHAPGEDLLGYEFSPTVLSDNGIGLLNLKELASIKNQLGRKWCLVETCGARGFHTAFDYFKSCEDFVLASGANLLVPFITSETLSGIGKYYWPQTLSDHSPWWDFYRSHADHVARVSAVLAQGQEHNRILVLMPTTTTWMHYTGSDMDVASGGTAKQELEKIRQSQIDLVLDLYHHQFDFDLGDEFILEEFGRAGDGKLVVGEREYLGIVIPSSMQNLKTSTLNLLRAYLQGGGTIYALTMPERVNGRKSLEPAALAKERGWNSLADTGALILQIREKFPPYFSSPDGRAIPGGLIWRRVSTTEGDLWYFCNPWSESLSAEFRLPGAAVKRLDTTSGQIASVPAVRQNHTIDIRLALPPRGHELLLVSPAAVATPLIAPQPVRTSVPLVELDIQRVKPNLLYIDYCDVEAYGQKRSNINTAAADTWNWRMQGFEGNPWICQFRRTLIEWPSDPRSGFSVAYRFVINPETSNETLQTLQVAVERPWLYQIQINGQAMVPHSGKRWFDEDMRVFSIARMALLGENAVTLTAQPFQTLCNIMPIYILGDFSLQPVEQGFVLTDCVKLHLGDWTRQGMPFYPDRVRYRYTFSLSQNAESLCVHVPEWEGSVVAVRTDGKQIAPIMHPPYESVLIGPHSPGKHILEIDVIGSLRNMMGSHHMVDRIPMRHTFEYGPEHMPAGEKYRMDTTGLYRKPELFLIQARESAN